jgi:hypothetical protein
MNYATLQEFSVNESPAALGATGDQPAIGGGYLSKPVVIPRRIIIPVVLAGAAAATAANYDAFWIAPPIPHCTSGQMAYQIMSVYAAWSVACSSTGTLSLATAAAGTAISGGTGILSATIALNGAANTPVAGALSTTLATLQMSPGMRLGLVAGGTLTSTSHLVVTVEIMRIKFMPTA